MNATISNCKANSGMEVRYFRELSDFLSTVNVAALKEYERMNPDKECIITRGGGSALGLNFAAAWELAAHGMPANPAVIELREKIVGRIRVAQTSSAFLDVTGGSEFDVGLVNAGVPESVWNYREENQRTRKTLALLCNTGTAGHVRDKWMAIRGAAYMALVDCLEQSGRFKCAVYCVGAVRAVFRPEAPPINAAVIRVKEPGHHYDPNVIAFCLGHPAWHRRLVFGYRDLLPANQNVHCNNGYGFQTHIDAQGLARTIGETEDIIDLTTPVQNETSFFQTIEGAHAWVEAQLKKYDLLES